MTIPDHASVHLTDEQIARMIRTTITTEAPMTEDFTRTRTNTEVIERSYSGSEIAALLMQDLRKRAGIPDGRGVVRTTTYSGDQLIQALHVRVTLSIDHDAFRAVEAEPLRGWDTILKVASTEPAE